MKDVKLYTKSHIKIDSQFSGLYGITSSTLIQHDQMLLEFIEAACRGGMRILQYRNNEADAARQLRQAKKLKILCANYKVTFIINNDVGLALKVDADGVHIGKNDMSYNHARKMLGLSKIIGVSCYDSIDHALYVQELGADYVAFGACFPSVSKPEARVNVSYQYLVLAIEQLSIPTVAIGGINLKNAMGVFASGVNMLAVISDLFHHEKASAVSVEERARLYSDIFNMHKQK